MKKSIMAAAIICVGWTGAPVASQAEKPDQNTVMGAIDTLNTLRTYVDVCRLTEVDIVSLQVELVDLLLQGGYELGSFKDYMERGYGLEKDKHGTTCYPEDSENYKTFLKGYLRQRDDLKEIVNK